MNKSLLIRITIIFALLTQISHAAELFYLISKHTYLERVISWVFALSVETSIFIFTIHGKKKTAILFGMVSWSINILTYWYNIGFTQKFVAMNIVSAIIPLTIYFYTELINEEKKPVMGRPPKEKK